MLTNILVDFDNFGLHHWILYNSAGLFFFRVGVNVRLIFILEGNFLKITSMLMKYACGSIFFPLFY